jgi:uridylate kinase
VGGGSVCRQYQQASEKIAEVSDEGRDWIGIYATRLNARLVVSALEGLGIKAKFNEQLNAKSFGEYSVLVGAGGVPGHSSDFTTIKMAVGFGIKKVINLGKPDYVYSANPDKDPTAKLLKQVTWVDYFKIIPQKWVPGMNVPFDILASKLAHKNNIEVIVALGKDIVNFQKILNNQKFKGTLLSNAK